MAVEAVRPMDPYAELEQENSILWFSAQISYWATLQILWEHGVYSTEGETGDKRG